MGASAGFYTAESLGRVSGADLVWRPGYRRIAIAKSKLHDKIHRVLAPKTAWEGVKGFCDESINKLGDNIRINDEHDDGVLFVRSTGLVASEDGWARATVSKDNLTNEEGLSYAVFNGRQKPIGTYQIIAREAPLLRPTKTLRGVPRVKCDLIAYSRRKSQLVGVEVKQDPQNDATNIQHGLLQAMAYGYILQHCFNADRDGLQRQVRKCLSDWCCQPNSNAKVNSVAYALAAPKAYFSESLAMHGKAADWIHKALKATKLPFAGFWVLEKCRVESIETNDPNKVIPITNCTIRIARNVKTLYESCR